MTDAEKAVIDAALAMNYTDNCRLFGAIERLREERKPKPRYEFETESNWGCSYAIKREGKTIASTARAADAALVVAALNVYDGG